LGDADRGFASNLTDIGANAIAGIPNADPAQGARLREANGQNGAIEGLCK
jgi:hypothetical protein